MERSATLAPAAVVGLIALIGVVAYAGLHDTPPACVYGGCDPGWDSSAPSGPAPLSLGAPASSHAAGTYWYNFSVLAAPSGLKLSALSFQLTEVTGLIVPSSSWSVAVLSGGHALVGKYLPNSGSWGSAPSMLVTSGIVFSLVADAPLAGYTFAIFGTSGSASGSVLVSIP